MRDIHQPSSVKFIAEVKALKASENEEGRSGVVGEELVPSLVPSLTPSTLGGLRLPLRMSERVDWTWEWKAPVSEGIDEGEEFIEDVSGSWKLTGER